MVRRAHERKGVGGRLFGDTLDDFASWAADRLGGPVAIYEVDGALTGLWPANPNLVATWYTSSITLQTVDQGDRYVAVEDASLTWALSTSRFNSIPRQRVSILYGLEPEAGSVNAAPVAFPLEVPTLGVAAALEFGAASVATPAEPTYADIYGKLSGPAVQYAYSGQWTQRFPDSQPYGMMQAGFAAADTWYDVAPPLDGLGSVRLMGLRVSCPSTNNGIVSVRFGPGRTSFLQVPSDSDEGWGDTEGLGLSPGLELTPQNRVQVSTTVATDT